MPDELIEKDTEKTSLIEKRNVFIKRMLPAMIAILSFMVFYFIYGGIYSRSVNDLMIAMIISVALASFIAIEPDKFTYFFVRAIAVSLFFVTFFGVCYAILFYEKLPFEDQSRLREAQVFLAVSSSGMMGGLMRYFSKDGVINDEEMNLWRMVHSAIVGLFVSVVLFLILRAGIINQTQIDTFNVWGVTGVSGITGFFADQVIERFSSLYREVIGKSGKQD